MATIEDFDETIMEAQMQKAMEEVDVEEENDVKVEGAEGTEDAEVVENEVIEVEENEAVSTPKLFFPVPTEESTDGTGTLIKGTLEINGEITYWVENTDLEVLQAFKTGEEDTYYEVPGETVNEIPEDQWKLCENKPDAEYLYIIHAGENYIKVMDVSNNEVYAIKKIDDSQYFNGAANEEAEVVEDKAAEETENEVAEDTENVEETEDVAVEVTEDVAAEEAEDATVEEAKDGAVEEDVAAEEAEDATVEEAKDGAVEEDIATEARKVYALKNETTTLYLKYVPESGMTNDSEIVNDIYNSEDHGIEKLFQVDGDGQKTLINDIIALYPDPKMNMEDGVLTLIWDEIKNGWGSIVREYKILNVEVWAHIDEEYKQEKWTTQVKSDFNIIDSGTLKQQAQKVTEKNNAAVEDAEESSCWCFC